MSDFVNREAEEFLLGMMMVESSIVPETVEILGTDAEAVFFIKQHQLVYDAILACYEDNKYADPMLVLENLESTGNDKRAGGHLFLYDIYARITETENFRFYAELVQKNAVRRQTASGTEKIRAVATDPRMSQEAIDETVLEQAAAIQNRRDKQSGNQSDIIEFPKDLITGVFDEYIRAYFGCTEVSPSFLFGTLKTLIGASLGRRVSLAGTHPLHPNFFTCIVGHTALARKSTALTCAEHIIGQGDMGVFILRSLSTPEGLISALIPPDGYRHGSTLPMTDVEEDEKAPTGIAATMGGNTAQLDTMLVESDVDTEGFRICLSIDEFSHLLKKAGKPHGDGLIQMLATAYNYPPKLQLPTRVSPLSADHPCVTMIGATTLHWLEASLKLEDIQGGFANRITYYLGSEAEQDWLFEDQPGDSVRLANVAKAINSLRLKYPDPVQFRFTPEASVEGQKWYESHRKALVQEKNPLIIMAAARTDVHVKKTALLFAALDNAGDDYEVHKTALEKAILLSEYLQKVVAHLYSNFNFSDDKRLETKIIEVLEKRGASLTAREVKQQIIWASSKDVNAALKELVNDGTVEEFPTKRTSRFAVRKSYLGEV